MKKTATVLFIFLLCSIVAYSQVVSTYRNAIIERNFRIATTNEADGNSVSNAQTNINYSDGLARTLQTIGYGQSPTQKDVVGNVVVYDNAGREAQRGILTPTSSFSGNYQPNPFTLANGFYNDSHAYSEITAYDNSPMNRVRVTLGAGQAWVTNNKPTQTFDELAGSDIRRYIVDANNDIYWWNYYPNNSLYKKRTIDEQGHTVLLITNRLGNIVEKQVEVAPNDFATTHYVYDDLQRLRAVIQPQGYVLSQTLTYNSTAYSNYIFAYQYDEKNRIVRKHIPNAGWTNYVYDKVNRPVMEQSALQATANKWSFTKYDLFGRVVIQGELATSLGHSTLQSLFEQIEKPYEVWQANSYTYSTQSYPIGYNSTDERVVNYYDHYNWIASEWAFNASSAYNAASYWPNATSLLTGSLVRDPENLSIVYHTVLHYDKKGRVLQTYQTHHKGGAARWSKPIITNYEYNFAGEVTKEKVLYQVDGQANTEALTWNEYDHVGRLLKIYHGINSSTPPTEIVRLSYDEAGRLQQKKLLPNGSFIYGGIPDYIYRPPNPDINILDIAKKAICLQPGTEITNTYSATIDPNATAGTPISGLQTVNYTWHVRGGLRGLNLDENGNINPSTSQGDLFSFKLDYETANQWDGNIGKQSWKSPESALRSYTYAYDAAKRLTAATYAGVNGEDFSIPLMTYDKNGNIKRLQRNGQTGGLPSSPTYGLIDNLTYTHNGNRLQSLTDASGSPEGFKESPWGGGFSFSFYADGSLKHDDNEQINNIVYDTYLKQPTEVQFYDGRKLKNYYDGGGTLLKTVYLDASNAVIETWEFLAGGMVFKNGVPYQLATPEGRAIFTNGVWSYEFDYKDYLGNTRVSFKANGNQLEQTASSSFDPWGLRLTGIGSMNGYQNRWEMQGHEKEMTFGLNRVNFGARTLNVTTGVWDRVDPLSELDFMQGGFNYVDNNPINRVDLFGMIDIDGDGIDDGEHNLLPEATVTAKRNTFNEALGFDLMYQAHARNRKYYGEASPYQKYFQEGGTVAAGVVVAPLAISWLAEVGAGAYVLEAFKAHYGRSFFRNAIANSMLNLSGQSLSNSIKKEKKVDIIGLSADIFLPSKIAAVAGGFNEGGYDFQLHEVYFETKSLSEGTLRSGLGIGLGSGLDKIKDSIVPLTNSVDITPNAIISTTKGLYDAMGKVYNELGNLIIEKTTHKNGEKK